MSSGPSYGALQQGVNDDFRRVRTLEHLLDSQFESLLRRDTSALVDSGEKIVLLSKEFDVGGPARKNIAKIFAMENGSLVAETTRSTREGAERMMLQFSWVALHARIVTCRRHHQRNLALMVAQMEIARIVLCQECHTYAGS